MAQINTRFIQKHETEVDWNKATFTPLQGEIIVYDKDENYSYERIKIGDGETDVKALPFANIEVISHIPQWSGYKTGNLISGQVYTFTGTTEGSPMGFWYGFKNDSYSGALDLMDVQLNIGQKIYIEFNDTNITKFDIYYEVSDRMKKFAEFNIDNGSLVADSYSFYNKNNDYIRLTNSGLFEVNVENIYLNETAIDGVKSPVSSHQVANKEYVDDKIIKECAKIETVSELPDITTIVAPTIFAVKKENGDYKKYITVIETVDEAYEDYYNFNNGNIPTINSEYVIIDASSNTWILEDSKNIQYTFAAPWTSNDITYNKATIIFTAEPFQDMISCIVTKQNKKYEMFNDVEINNLIEKKNLIPYPYLISSQEINGLTITDNGDGTITVNGTSTDSVMLIIATVPLIKGQEYSLSGCPKGGDGTYNTWGLGLSTYMIDGGNGISFTSDVDVPEMPVQIAIGSGVTCNNLLFKPQLEKGLVITPYSPPFPIYQDLSGKQDKFAEVLTEEKDGVNGFVINKPLATVRANSGGLSLEGYIVSLNSTMADSIYCNDKKLQAVAEPEYDNEATNKSYVDRNMLELEERCKPIEEVELYHGAYTPVTTSVSDDIDGVYKLSDVTTTNSTRITLVFETDNAQNPLVLQILDDDISNISNYQQYIGYQHKIEKTIEINSTTGAIIIKTLITLSDKANKTELTSLANYVNTKQNYFIDAYQSSNNNYILDAMGASYKIQNIGANGKGNVQFNDKITLSLMEKGGIEIGNGISISCDPNHYNLNLEGKEVSIFGIKPVRLKSYDEMGNQIPLGITNLATPDGTDLTAAVNVEYINNSRIGEIESALAKIIEQQQTIIEIQNSLTDNETEGNKILEIDGLYLTCLDEDTSEA